GLVGGPGSGGLHGSLPARRCHPRPQTAPRHGRMPGLDERAGAADLPSPTGGLDAPPLAPISPGPGLGRWELVAQTRVEPSQSPCVAPGPSPSVLALPSRILAVPTGPRRPEKNPWACGLDPTTHQGDGLKSWKLLDFIKVCRVSWPNDPSPS